MRELTVQEMTEVDGRIGWRGFLGGFACGVSVAAAVVGTFGSISFGPLATIAARRVFYSGTAFVCAGAFFV
jgi:hypothetical protein